MPAKTFNMVRRDAPPLPVEYHPIRVEVGGKRHDLALHKGLITPVWTVSDPKSGARVLEVAGSLYGVRTTSRGLPLADAKKMARTQVLALAERVGAERFNAALANPKPF